MTAQDLAPLYREIDGVAERLERASVAAELNPDLVRSLISVCKHEAARLRALFPRDESLESAAEFLLREDVTLCREWGRNFLVKGEAIARLRAALARSREGGGNG